MNAGGQYRLQLQGWVDERELNAYGPLQVTVEQFVAGTTWLSVCTDQAGLMGLLRHLHDRGLVFLIIAQAGANPLPDS
jgi:hypothetical protein